MRGLKAAEQDAARHVFERFVTRLIRLASDRMGMKLQRKLDAEDVVQSVFKTFFRRYPGDEFHFVDWNGLWALLAAITIHKCGHRTAQFQAARRDVASEEPEGPLSAGRFLAWNVISREPDPSQVLMFIETVDELMARLDARENEILTMALKGSDPVEIAKKVKRSVRTVRRVLKWAHKELERLLREEHA